MIKIIITLFLIFNISYAFKVEQAFNIKIVKVTKKEISKSKEFYGKIVPREDSVYEFSLRFDGFITKLYANKSYSYIQKGNILFDIYSKEIYNLFDELKIAKRTSKSLYNSTLNKFDLFNLTAKDFNKKDKTVKIRSPFSGYLTKKNVYQGSFAKKGKLIFEITDLSSVWIIANIYQKDLNFIKQNMDTEITIDGIENKFNSTVEYIYPTINSKNQTIPVRIKIDNKDLKLFPNMFAKVKIFTQKRLILTLPRNAIVQRDGKQYVFLKVDKEYEPSEVKAVKIGKYYHIIEGLEEGDEVVTNALFLLDSDAVTNGLYSDDW